MRQNSPRLRFLLPTPGRIAVVVVCAMAAALGGCVTPQQVTEIVARSNAALLAGQLGAMPSPEGGMAAPPWADASARIDAFAEAHATEKKAIAPLRIRQAMLLLTHKQFNLAAEAFDAAALNDLQTDRDRALKRNQAHLLWWFATSEAPNWTADDVQQATRALTDLAREQAELSRSPEIRDYLAELRAWIGIAKARRGTANPTDARLALEDALNTFALIFTPDELAPLTASAPTRATSPLGGDLRRQLRARAILLAARNLNQDDALGARPATAAFDRAIN